MFPIIDLSPFLVPSRSFLKLLFIHFYIPHFTIYLFLVSTDLFLASRQHICLILRLQPPALSANKANLTVYFDLSKAFNVGDNETLQSKLAYYGVGENVIKWFGSYRPNRKGLVRVNHMTSTIFKTIFGVPQGSVLGHRIFSIFINDIPLVISQPLFLHYTNDIKIYREIWTFDDCVGRQAEANKFSDCCSENKLRLNRSNTKVLLFSRKTQNVGFLYWIEGALLTPVTEIRILAVVFDSNLRFNVHVGKMVWTSLRLLSLLCRLTIENSTIPTRF